ncbi:hypothetical protein [Corallococcus sp. Z5C101001]|uniref:hypothetical protein n=1 Tax=Corallococcus sp. Z5C101001 TaxID=2596829 RepID=UPI00117DA867|nr:hypothetical protein [Corallococcus sp. Z5C101001]TSC34350.1 hypothetical protein FOF48_04805 [Corallococcus sp. Z5C101001]
MSTTSTPQLPPVPPTTDVISIPVAGPLDVDGDNGEFRLIQTGSSLVLVGVDDDQKLQGYFSSSTVAYLSRPQGNPKRLDPWTQFTIEKDSTQSTLDFETQKRIGVVALRDLVYVFWIDTANNSLCAARVAPGSGRATTDWCQISLPATTGGSSTPVKVLAKGVSACVGKGPTEILINYLAWDSSHNALQVCHLVLDTDGYNPLTNDWVSRVAPWSVTAPATSPTQTSSNLSHLDVRTILVSQPGATGTSAPVNCVIAALWDEAHFTATTFSWTLDAECHASPSPAPAPMLLTWPGSSPKSRKALGMGLAVDPAGRLVALFADNNKSNVISIAVIQDILPLRQLGTSATAPVWKEYGKIFTNATEDTEGPLSMCFSIGAIPESTSQDTSTLPIILGMAWVRSEYSVGSPIQMSSLKYGDFKLQTALHPPKQENMGGRLLTSICDPFPMPLPAPEVWGNASPDGMADWNMFDYEMDTTQEDVVLDEINIAASLGVQYSSKETASVEAFDGLKAGASFGLSVKAGVSGRIAWQGGKFTAQSIKVQTKAYRHPYFPLDDASPYLVRPYGCYFGRSLFWLRSQYGTATNLAFNQDASFSPAPLIVAHWPVASEDADETAAGDFFSYACTPGVVDSYTEAAINARMFSLYTECVNRLATAGNSQEQIRQIFTAPDGTDLSTFYTGQNYVAAVVKKYGTETNINGQKYLKFAMSGGSVCDGQYRVSSGQSTGFGVHLDINAYAGFVQSAEVGTPMGISATGETYVGASLDFSFSYKRESTSNSSSGVGVYTYLNTLAPTQSMSARLYILKEAYLWALELKYFPAIARDWYLQALRNAKAQGEFTSPTEEPNLDMLAGTTTADSLLLYEQSLPTRFLFVVTGWDQGPLQLAPTNVPKDLPGGYDIATFNAGVPDGSTFNLPGPCDVAYGANGHYRFIPGVTGTVTFNAATFGDPQSGGANLGYYRQLGYPNRTTYNVQQNFTRLCSENGTVNLGTTPTTVAFGIDTRWNVVGGLTGSVTASDSTFGDPAHGSGKELRVLRG